MSDDLHPRLSKAQRHERIIAELRAMPTLRVSLLAQELGVSTETIRRDLDELGHQGLISRTYGGAARPLASEPAIRERHALMVEERQRIALAVARRIRPGEVVMIGGGSTTVHVARRMAAECRELTVITHSFGVATVLSTNPTMTVIMTAGRYDAHEGNLRGPETAAFLRGYHADRAILGASGISADGPCDVDADAAAVYRVMLERAALPMIVADHGKFEQRALAIYARWAEIGALVSDRAPTGPLAEALARAEVEVLIAEPRSANLSRAEE